MSMEGWLLRSHLSLSSGRQVVKPAVFIGKHRLPPVRRLPRCKCEKPSSSESGEVQSDIPDADGQSTQGSRNGLLSIPQKGYLGGFGQTLDKSLYDLMVGLPGTQSMSDIIVRSNALIQWQNCLKKGALQDLEMPSFIRRYPKLLNSLCFQMLELVHKFEEAMMELESSNEGSSQNPQGRPQYQQQQPMSGDDGDEQGMQGGGDGNMSPEDITDEMIKEALETQNGSGSENGKPQNELEIELESKDGNMQSNSGKPTDQKDGSDDDLAEEIAALAEDLVSEFQEKLEPVMENLKKAKVTFEDLGELLDEQKGFDLSSGMWRHSGWNEVDKLRKKLQKLKELRELVRSLGRAGGKGPMRRAPAEAFRSKGLPGVIRSPLQPEETRGLARSDDLSRMLPAEAALMAAGWPKADDSSGSKREGSRAARLLHTARRAERNLLSYERTGWVDDEPTKVLPWKEFRPAAEQGPIIVCLDTSASMQGPREVVAKAVALECLRGAHRQQRLCYLYAFSGPKDVEELELGLDSNCMEKLLRFLEFSFSGGTCVEEALTLAINRLKSKEWEQADILIVTDGEMATPNEQLLSQTQAAITDLGLEVHGLLVGVSSSPAMEAVCSHLHMFKSWDIVRSAS